MKMLHVFRILLVLLLVFVTLAAARPAYAGTHSQEIYTLDEYWTWKAGDPNNLSPCDFDVTVHEYGSLRMNFWFDEYNRPIHEIDIYGQFNRDLIANGKTVPLKISGPQQFRVEYYSDEIVLTVKTVGANWIATLPHYGIVRGGGGQYIETYTITPDWEEVISYSLDKLVGNFNWDWGPLCAYWGS